MQIGIRHLLATTAATVVITVGAHAAGLKQVGTIAIPGEPLDSFDISFVDQLTNRYYLADRTNKSIDVFDTKTDTYVGRVPGFTGARPGGMAGPNGVVTANDGTEVWAGDGDSTVKVIDVKSMKIVDTISTGGKKRADEVGYDPKDQVFIIANDGDEPPFLTLISTKPGHKIIGKVVIEQATDGIEQSQYNPADGMFYVDIPELNKDKTKGGLAVIDPNTAKLVKILPVDNCIPHGLAVGTDSTLFLGCNAGTQRNGLPPQLSVFDISKGQVIATIPGVGGSDESAANNKIGQYYSATGANRDGPVFAVVDAKTNTLVQKIPVPPGTHSVAVSEANNHVYVPVVKASPCGGCIVVFAPE
jgi:DNA-binding beta-propeller fold protein YncE